MSGCNYKSFFFQSEKKKNLNEFAILIAMRNEFLIVCKFKAEKKKNENEYERLCRELADQEVEVYHLIYYLQLIF